MIAQIAELRSLTTPAPSASDSEEHRQMQVTIKRLEDQIRLAQNELEGTSNKFSVYERQLSEKAQETEDVR